jgi:hypothetical protein
VESKAHEIELGAGVSIGFNHEGEACIIAIDQSEQYCEPHAVCFWADVEGVRQVIAALQEAINRCDQNGWLQK